MTNKTWQILVAAIATAKNPPGWLRELAYLSYEDVLRLPKYEDAGDGQVTAPWVEEKLLAADYLDFLREQIRIDARGAEWKELLQKRLQALKPFVGKNVLTATFHQKPYAVTLKINPDTGKLFHEEMY
jgi:hypothetical protein